MAENFGGTPAWEVAMWQIKENGE